MPPTANEQSCTAKETQIRKQTPLDIRKAQREQQEARIREALLEARRAEREARLAESRHLPSEDLAPYLALSPRNSMAIRPHEEFRTKSKALSKQVLDLVDHLFVRYPVPLFLYRTMLSYDGLELVFNQSKFARATTKRPPPDGQYRPWFKAIARGDSFATLARNVFTRKEAHFFHRAPYRFSIEQNILWAKAAAVGVPSNGCDHIVTRLYDLAALFGDRLPEVLRFYAEAWPQLENTGDAYEITDYIRSRAMAPDFSFKGRTLRSVQKLAEEWHDGEYYFPEEDTYRSWEPLLSDWSWSTHGMEVTADELTNSKSLREEGRIQRHCVGSYWHSCNEGRTSIISFRRTSTEGKLLSRLTIEVAMPDRRIEQVRGKANRAATEEETRLLRRWAKEAGLSFSQYAL